MLTEAKELIIKTDFKRKIILQEEVSQCPLCLSHDQSFLFEDFEGCRYVKCKVCNLVFQNPRYEIAYEKEYWGKAMDPDGNIRDHRTERESKIKNLGKFGSIQTKKSYDSTLQNNPSISLHDVQI